MSSFGEDKGIVNLTARAGCYGEIPVHRVQRWPESEKNPEGTYGYVNVEYVYLLINERDELLKKLAESEGANG